MTTIPSIVTSGDIQPTSVNVGPFRSFCFIVIFFFSLCLCFYSIVGINHEVSLYGYFKWLCNCNFINTGPMETIQELRPSDIFIISLPESIWKLGEMRASCFLWQSFAMANWKFYSLLSVSAMVECLLRALWAFFLALSKWLCCLVCFCRFSFSEYCIM